MEEILKSIQDAMKVKEEEFNKVLSELNTLEENYAVRKKQLVDAKEQIRGAYTALYLQYEKFTKSQVQSDNVGIDVTDKVLESADNSKVVVKTEKKTKNDSKKVTKKDKSDENQEKLVGGLTSEEIEKLNKAMQQPEKDKNGNEIPEYLQQEYNK